MSKRRIVNIAVDWDFRKAMRIKSAQQGKKMLELSRDLAKSWLNDETNTTEKKKFDFRL